MTAEPGGALFVRAVRHGQPAWRHPCGRVEFIDLLADDPARWRCPQATEEGQGRPEDWQPVYVFTGDRCDQCHGHGWVPIAGRVDGAPCGYLTVVECTACAAQGIANTGDPVERRWMR